MRKLVVILKKIALPCLAVCLCNGWSSRERAESFGAKARINLTIADDNNVVVDNANVEVYFGLSVREGKSVKGISDDKGNFVADGKTTGEVYVNVSKKGFYKTTKKIELYNDEHREVYRGRWMPETIMTNVLLRKIINPIHLLKADGTIPIPTTNTWLGFDMALKDFTAPHGKGKEADCEVLFQWDGKPQPYSSFYSMDIRFSGKGAGAYRSVRNDESQFPWVYKASEGEFAPLQIHMFRHRVNRNFEKEVFDQNHPLICRSRCRYDINGKLVSAHYSLIIDLACSASWQDKGIFRFSYLFNSTANDRNLEEQNIYNTPNFGTIGGLE